MKKKTQVKQKTKKEKNKISKQPFNPDLEEEEEEYRVVLVHSIAKYAWIPAKSKKEALKKAKTSTGDYDWENIDGGEGDDETFECYD